MYNSTLSGQPIVEKGRIADENQVSRTSGSCSSLGLSAPNLFKHNLRTSSSFLPIIHLVSDPMVHLNAGIW